jgi:hypothetical protein
MTKLKVLSGTANAHKICNGSNGHAQTKMQLLITLQLINYYYYYYHHHHHHPQYEGHRLTVSLKDAVHVSTSLVTRPPGCSQYRLGPVSSRQAFCHMSRKLHEHEQERTDMITTSKDIDSFRGKTCYVNYDMSFCCHKFITLALLTESRKVR